MRQANRNRLSALVVRACWGAQPQGPSPVSLSPSASSDMPSRAEHMKGAPKVSFLSCMPASQHSRLDCHYWALV